MKMTRQPLIFAVSLAAVLALTACGKKDESATAVPDQSPPATVPATAVSAPPAMDNAAGVSLSSVELGSTVDASNKIVATGTSFAPKDTIYAAVTTSGSGNATLDAKWSYQDGQTVHQDSKTFTATGAQTTAFMINKPDGFPTGNYKVEISMNGAQVASKDFSIK